VAENRYYRRSIRLPEYDYGSEGYYFVTIVTAGRLELFGTIVDGEMLLSPEGACVERVWANLPRHYPRVSLDAFIVMPNHVHGIQILGPDTVAAGKRVPLSEVVRGFKTFSAHRANAIRGVSSTPLWQRNYYERTIRDDHELQRVRQYIDANPAAWDNDAENQRQPS
jgi:putative transposase